MVLSMPAPRAMAVSEARPGVAHVTHDGVWHGREQPDVVAPENICEVLGPALVRRYIRLLMAARAPAGTLVL